jgi:hypothetical protein
VICRSELGNSEVNFSAALAVTTVSTAQCVGAQPSSNRAAYPSTAGQYLALILRFINLPLSSRGSWASKTTSLGTL